MKQNSELMSETEVAEASEQCRRVLGVMNEVILGKQDLVRVTFAAILAGGHSLLEGLPGLGKTVLAKSFAKALGVEFRRIQFTPDLLPSDITGSYVLEETEEGREMEFYPGPIFANIVLADEVNRASPKTQSALLEAMSESQVTQMGNTMDLAAPFCVLATQNPIEMEGTYPLPEAQMDRFAVKLDVLGSDRSVLEKIITERKDGRPVEPPEIMNVEDVLDLQEMVPNVFLPAAVAEHISGLVSMTHPDSGLATEHVRDVVKYGSSPRGAIWLSQVSKALALVDGRPGVGFEDVQLAAPSVLGHRITLHHAARLEGTTGPDVVKELVSTSEERIVGQ
ncbi:MAG: AAA family ATPase [Candidatus Brocadiia bacterium]